MFSPEVEGEGELDNEEIERLGGSNETVALSSVFTHKSTQFGSEK